MLGGSPGSGGRITVPSEHFKLPPIALPFSSSVLALSRTDPPMAFDSTLKSEELLIMNAPLIVFPVQEFSSGSPMAKNRGAVALCTSMLPLILLLQMYGVKPAEYVPVIEIPPLICAVQMSASEKAPAGVVQTALASM